MIKHKHHILPKHEGGTDDPSNLIELTVKEHAEVHRIRYEETGNKFDFLAWKGLLGQIGKDEILLEIYRENGRRASKGNIGREPWNKGKKIPGKSWNEEQKSRYVPWNKGLTKDDPRVQKYTSKLTGLKKTEEHKRKISEANIGRKFTDEQKEALRIAKQNAKRKS